MAKRTIVLKNEDILRKRSREVTEFNDKLGQLIDDMAETMRENDGVGLAAVQVGVLRRVVTIDIGEGLMELVNPEIVEQEGRQNGTEGCLSFPDEWGQVERPMRVKVVAKNREGKEVTYEGEGLLARALCHECDHLNGVLFVDLATELETTEERPRRRRRR